MSHPFPEEPQNGGAAEPGSGETRAFYPVSLDIMTRARLTNRRSASWLRGAAVALIVIGALAGILTVALFRATDPAFAHHTCENRFNTDGYFGNPKGTWAESLRLHYTLIPFQLVCAWERSDGTGVETTRIELGTWVPVTSLVTLVGGAVLLLTTTLRAKEPPNEH